MTGHQCCFCFKKSNFQFIVINLILVILILNSAISICFLAMQITDSAVHTMNSPI